MMVFAPVVERAQSSVTRPNGRNAVHANPAPASAVSTTATGRKGPKSKPGAGTQSSKNQPICSPTKIAKKYRCSVSAHQASNVSPTNWVTSVPWCTVAAFAKKRSAVTATSPASTQAAMKN